MALLKYSDFEAGSVTGVRGFDALTLTELAINASSPLYGTRDVLATFVAGNSYGSYGSSTLTAGGKDTLYAVINGFQFGALPAADSRIATWRNGSTNVMQVLITSAGRLKITCGATSVTGTGVTLAANTTYRIGIRYTKGTGADAVGQAFVATGNNAFGAAEAATAVGNATLAVTDARFGWTAAITMGTMRFDNIILNDSVMPGINGAALDVTSPTYVNRVTDAVAFPNWAYSGDSGDVATATFEYRATGGGGYTAGVPVYDRTNNIAHFGHNVDFGSGNVAHKGVIALTPNNSYDFRVLWTCAEGVIHDTTSAITTTYQETDRAKTMLARLDPLAHSGRGSRVVPTAWWWNGSNTVTAANIRLNAWIVMAQGDETDVSPSSVGSMTSVRNGATDIPIYQYIAPEVRRDTAEVHDIVLGRNTWINDAAARTSFEAAYAETWFAHDGGSAIGDRIYNQAYDTFVLNWSVPGLRSWVYGQFLVILYGQHTDATPAATRFQGVIQDNLQGTSIMDQQWRSTNVAPVAPDETAIDTATEYSAAQAAFLAFLKATGTYIGVNNVNATEANHLTHAPNFNALFMESIFTSYSSAVGAAFLSGTNWKADVDHVIALRAAAPTTHIINSMQLGTAPITVEVEFAAWCQAMVIDVLGAGGHVVTRPTDNADYDEDEISTNGTTVYDQAWGTPTGAYVQDTSVGSGNERVYTRTFTGGKIWFNVTAGSLTATGGPALIARQGAFVPTVAAGAVKIKQMTVLGVA